MGQGVGVSKSGVRIARAMCRGDRGTDRHIRPGMFPTAWALIGWLCRLAPLMALGGAGLWGLIVVVQISC